MMAGILVDSKKVRRIGGFFCATSAKHRHGVFFFEDNMAIIAFACIRALMKHASY